jgi:D-glycero-alpha-D-manno-heptose-7-phosphate kinase
MQVTKSGSVRVDLVGGTLDLEPINLILPNVITLNVATTLKAKVDIRKRDDSQIHIKSLDYDKTYNFDLSDFNQDNLYQGDFFKEMTFLCQLIDLFKLDSGLEIELSSNAPAGSGLGGSSSMGVVFFSALSELCGEFYSVKEIVQKVKGTEGRILNQGMPGYQDYFPALCGGVLALRGLPGDIQIEQLYKDDLVNFLEDHITLVYSGIARDSGINNWDVYKKFFDKDIATIQALSNIARISYETYQAIKDENYVHLLELIHAEGEERKGLSQNIVPREIAEVFSALEAEFTNVGMKMCGAGGGGCFIITHQAKDKSEIEKAIAKTPMRVLDFKIDKVKE